MKLLGNNNLDQKFIWPETKNPILLIVRLFGRSSIFIILIITYLSNKYLKTKIPFLIIFDIFFISMAWLFMQQRLKVYKLAGWVVLFSTIWVSLVELNVLVITPWW